MTFNGWLQIFVFLALIFAVTKPMGIFITHVFNREKTFLDPLLRPIERLIYRVARVKPEQEMDWKTYAVCFVLSGLAGALVIQRTQRFLPWYYPEYMTTPMTPDLAMNNAVSFSTTTTWQAYAGKSTMSYV